MTHLYGLPEEPPQRNEHLLLTDRRGELLCARGRNGNVPAMVVRSGELPEFPMPVIVREKEERTVALLEKHS